MMSPEKQTPKTDRAGLAHENGFSLLELLAVFAVILVMTAITIFAFKGHRSAFRSEDQALQIISVMREASQRAITQRQPQRLEIDLTDKVIRIVDENTASGGVADDTVYKTITLADEANVRLATDPVAGVRTSKPTNITMPVAPAQPNFTPATFTNNSSNHLVWSVRYMSDGRVVDANGAINSATLFVWVPQTGSPDKFQPNTDMRAISFFGSSGTTRMWGYTGTGSNFVAR